MKRLIIFILFFAGALRFVGTKPGFPPYHVDEGISYSAASSMVKNANIDPLRYDYPGFVPLINYLTFKIFFIPVKWISFYINNFGSIVDGFVRLPTTTLAYKEYLKFSILEEYDRSALFWSRYVTSFFGTGVVFLVFLVGQKLFGQRVGIFASLLTAVSWRQVLNSHLGLPDIYNAFFLLLSFSSTLYLTKVQTRASFFLAALFAGLSLATKYQAFALIPLLFVCAPYFFRKQTWRWALTVPLIVVLVFVIANPYHFIKIEETVDWLASVASKYEPGKWQLYPFPFSYLFYFGLGRVTSILIILGGLIGLIKETKKTLLLLAVILPFFLVMNFYTTGGFYTRNYVTIIPFLLILAGLSLIRILNLKPKILGLVVLALALGFGLAENLPKSIVVAKEYQRPWNYEVLNDWLDKNISPQDKVAWYDSLDPLAGSSLAEFSESGFDYAVINLDWMSSNFYGWMKKSPFDPAFSWRKPTVLLEDTYHAMATRELTDFTVFKIVNPWQAPDTGFVVSKIPKYKLVERKDEISVEIGDPIPVQMEEGYVLNYQIETRSQDEDIKDGYVFLVFYKSLDDAVNGRNRFSVRVSPRNDILNHPAERTMIGQVPPQAAYIVINFGVLDPAKAKVTLSKLSFYRAEVEVDFGEDVVFLYHLDEAILFPESQGGM